MSLTKKLQKWVENDLISVEQSDKIREYELQHNGSIFLRISFGMVGLLIGLGICLIVASNWDAIPVLFRIVAAFGMLALFIAGAYREQQNSNSKLKEMFLVLCFLMIAANIGLIGQTFNLEGGWTSFAFGWALLSLPYVYCSRSRVFNVAWWVLAVQGLCRGYFVGWLLEIMPFLIFFDLYRYEEHIIPVTLLFVAVMTGLNYAARKIDARINKYTLLADGFGTLCTLSAYVAVFMCGLFYMSDSYFASAALIAHLLVLAFLAFRMFCAVHNQDAAAFRRNALLAEVYLFLTFASCFGNLLTTGVGFILGGVLLLVMIRVLQKTSRYIKGMEIFNG